MHSSDTGRLPCARCWQGRDAGVTAILSLFGRRGFSIPHKLFQRLIQLLRGCVFDPDDAIWIDDVNGRPAFDVPRGGDRAVVVVRAVPEGSPVDSSFFGGRLAALALV